MTVKEIKIQYALGSLSYDVKQTLARNHNTSKEILEILSKDKVGGIRYWVAANLNTPVKVLRTLSKCRPRYHDSIRIMARRTLKKKVDNAGVA